VAQRLHTIGANVMTILFSLAFIAILGFGVRSTAAQS
jgi:hypothetical protein